MQHGVRISIESAYTIMSKKGRKLRMKNAQGDNFTHGKRRGMNKSIRKGMPDGRGVSVLKAIAKSNAKVDKKVTMHIKGDASKGTAKIKNAPPKAIPYSDTDIILLVGEGNFSFAASLATLLGSGELITASSYDSKEEVIRKYPDAEGHISTLTDLGGSVLFDIDATRLSDSKPLSHLRGLVTKLAFNFPHAGAGIKDQDHNILSNQRLMSGFFNAARSLLSQGLEATAYTQKGPMVLPPGQILVTLKSGPPYDEWNLVELAATAGLGVKSCTEFKPDGYPGYEHRRTIGHIQDKEGNVELEGKSPKTWSFFDRKAGMASSAARKALLKRSRKAVRKDKSSNMQARKKRERGDKITGKERYEENESSDDDMS